MIKFMYVFCLLVWGLNFIAVKIQGNPVSLDISLLYRVSGAAVCFIIFAAIKSPPAVHPNDLPFVIIFGLCNFAISYLLLYYATIVSTAALVTLVFSTKTILTPIALRIFLGDQLDRRLVIGGFFSLAGVFCLLYPSLNIEKSQLVGLILAIAGTMVTAIGDAASARNSRNGVNPISANCIGFVSATIFLLLICTWNKSNLTLPVTINYLGALFYLIFVASFIAWIFYLRLVKEIGASQSSYMVALFPVLGGLASVIIGDSELTYYLIFGCILACVGAMYSLGLLQYIKRAL